jgi:serpin B
MGFVTMIGIVGALLLPQRAVGEVSRASLLTQAYDSVGLDLLKRFAQSPGNVVFSPYSIGVALSMVSSGARGDTETEMLRVLKQHLTPDDLATANGDVSAVLDAYDRSAVAPSCPVGTALMGGRCKMNASADGRCPISLHLEGAQCIGGATFPASAQLLVANALMVSKPGVVSLNYAALLQNKYRAELFGHVGLAEINAWVNRKTEGKIDKILDPPMPDMAILDAVYFKSKWASPFDERQTRNETFQLSSSQPVSVPMMHRTGDYATVARNGYRAVRLPYAIPALAMVIVLPNDIDGLGDLIRRFDDMEQTELLMTISAPSTKQKLVALTLPRFKSAFGTDLVPAFRAAGMKLAFDRDRADFSGMTGRPLSEARLAINRIAHRAMIDVTEERTEAAAATAVGMLAAAAAARPLEPEIFRVDHPFLFYLTDSATGAVLFSGYTFDPR